MTEAREVTATAKKLENQPSATVLVDWPESLEEAAEMFSEEAILSNAFANGRVTVQAGIRRMLEAGKTEDEIQEAFKDWKLGVATAGLGGGDPLDRAAAKFKTMTPEEQAKFLEKLRAEAEG